jgi:hypothetical protein
MTSRTRPARPADEFAAFYPTSLPRRLEWLSENLLIERPRFLRLMGLTPQEVEQNLDAPWEAVAERWQIRAIQVSELLGRLIAEFRSDWRPLAQHLHQLAEGTQRQPAPPVPPEFHAARLDVLPLHEREKVLLTLIAEGGPGDLTWLIKYLSLPLANGANSSSDAQD